MAYRNKTYVAFASEDIGSYRMMEAWRENKRIPFHFHDAHDLYVARDTSQRDTIKRNLRNRLLNTKQAILLLSENARRKAGAWNTFLNYELEVIDELELPLVLVNLDGRRGIATDLIPARFRSYYTISVPFKYRIIQHALDEYVDVFRRSNPRVGDRAQPHFYRESVYRELGIAN